MKNVTITLEEEVADWTRICAAKDRTSMSRWIGMLLKQKMQAEAGYQRAMQQFFSSGPLPLKNGGKYPTRDEVHGR
jgi:DNA mismatch repair protein MutH